MEIHQPAMAGFTIEPHQRQARLRPELPLHVGLFDQKFRRLLLPLWNSTPALR